MATMTDDQAERRRLEDDARREKNWRRWGPYLSERQWGTVREDYSLDGDAWGYFPHDQARSRAYRWGEDGLLGITDRECRLCFALALWNGNDPILKERLFGLGGPEGNHGEDVKEIYYYLDATPSYAYLKALYKYPQAAFPYARLVDESRRRGRGDPEPKLEDTGVFDGDRYFDVLVEYAKASSDDILVRITCTNHGPDAAPLHVLPTLWLRNTWSWGRTGEGYWPAGQISATGSNRLRAEHPSLGIYELACGPADNAGGSADGPRLLFTDNETNAVRLFGRPNPTRFLKDAFHRLVVEGEEAAVNAAHVGTKSAAWYRMTVAARGQAVLRLRLHETAPGAPPAEVAFDDGFDRLFDQRRAEADAFHAAQRSTPLSDEERRIARQADAGLLWSRQFYNYVVEHWLDGDPAHPAPPAERKQGRNAQWRHFYGRDVISMPDKWEYPWFAAWDLAFHCVAMARIDPEFAKAQLLLLCREWYMHPNGQLPAYEFGLSDVNPPVHAWAAWRVFELDAAQNGGKRDVAFLESAFLKCLVNFTWWVDRKDDDGNNLFAGGFLGLDNIGVFDRSKPLPHGGRIEQADATAWMAFYCTTMLAMAFELAERDNVYADIASKFFEHFVSIAQAINEMGGGGLWDEQDGFYYDQARIDGRAFPLRIRSAVGVIPLFAAESLDEDRLATLPLFKRRLDWFVENKPALALNMACTRSQRHGTARLLSIPSRDQLTRVLRYVLDEDELLSPYGVRSLSKVHAAQPYMLALDGQRKSIQYVPGESDNELYGGNSNWRGPVWFPINYLLIEALKRHHHFYGDTFTIECPRGSGHVLTLRAVAEELERRLAALFLPDASGRWPARREHPLYTTPAFRDLILFHEYFHGDTGRGLGASHQTGWTALVANVLERVAATRDRKRGGS
jgi:hypothetical protein